jgi:hypothetical protein
MLSDDAMNGRRRPDLVLTYIAELAATDRSLVGLEMIPFRIRNF